MAAVATPYNRGMDFEYDDVFESYIGKDRSFSVRCVK